MYVTRNRAKYERHKPDMWLMLAAFSLCVIGLIMVYSASQYEGLQRFSNVTYLASKQFLWFVIAMVSFSAASMVDGRWVKRYPYAMGVTACIILLGVHIFAERTLGASSRFRVGGMSIQPSEFAKLLILMFWAATLSQVKAWNQFFRSAKDAAPLALVGLCLLLVFKEPDMGGASILGCMVLALWYLKGMPLPVLGGIIGTGGVLGYAYAMSNPYQAARITAFLDPWSHKLGKGYNAVQSMMAFANGGFSGVGLGNGAQKFEYLPEQHADFIYSVIGEEFGLIGAAVVAGLFIVILYRGMAIAARQQDEFSTYLSTGIVCALVGQGLLNMLVAVSAVPTTGLTMPFVSYGGSSMVVSAIMIGMLVKLSACRKEGATTCEERAEEREALPRFVVPQPPALKARKTAPADTTQTATAKRTKGVKAVAQTGAGSRGNRWASLPRY